MNYGFTHSADKYNYSMKESTKTIHSYSSDIIRIIEETAQKDFKEVEIETETYKIRMKK